jgi:hypothetical protein
MELKHTHGHDALVTEMVELELHAPLPAAADASCCDGTSPLPIADFVAYVEEMRRKGGDGATIVSGRGRDAVAMSRRRVGLWSLSS